MKMPRKTPDFHAFLAMENLNLREEQVRELEIAYPALIRLLERLRAKTEDIDKPRPDIPDGPVSNHAAPRPREAP